MRHAEDSSFYKVYILNVVVHVRTFMMLCYLLNDVAYSCCKVFSCCKVYTKGCGK